MSPELKTVFEFCLRKSEDSAPSERSKLYRGLAEFCGDPVLAAKFRSAAEAIESADRLQRELALKFTTQKTKAHDGHGHN